MAPSSKPSQRKPLLRNIQKHASAQMNQALQREALRKLLLTFGVGAAGGAAFRGLKGIGDMVRDTQETVVPPMYQAQPVRIQTPPKEEKVAFDWQQSLSDIGQGVQSFGQKALNSAKDVMPTFASHFDGRPKMAGGAIVAPALLKAVADKAAAENDIIKQQRKALEARTLLRQKK